MLGPVAIEVPAGEKKSDITTYMTSKVKWIPMLTPSPEKRLIVDLDAIAIQSCIKYVQRDKFAMDFVYEFFTEKYIDEIYITYKTTIENIKKTSKNVIFVSSIYSESYCKKPKLCSLDYQSLVMLKRSIHTYLIKRSDIYKILAEKTGENIIFPSEKHLTDKALLICSMDCDEVISYDPHVLAFGKSDVCKFYDNKWFRKTRKDFNDVMKLGDINDFTYSCLLLGTRFGKAKKSTTLKDIRNCKDKRAMVIDELSGNSILDYLQIF